MQPRKSSREKFYQWLLLISLVLFGLISLVSISITYALNKNAYANSLTMQGDSQMVQISDILHNYGMQTVYMRNSSSMVQLVSDAYKDKDTCLQLEKQVGDDIWNSIGQLDFFLGVALSDMRDNYYLKNTKLTDFSDFIKENIDIKSLSFEIEKYALNLREYRDTGAVIYTSPVFKEGIIIGYFHLILSNKVFSLPTTQKHQEVFLISNTDKNVLVYSEKLESEQTQRLLDALETSEKLIRYDGANGEAMLAVVSTSEKFPLRLVTAVTMENMSKETLPFTIFQAIISLLLLSITVVLVFFLFKRITKPVSDLIEQCSQVANGNCSIEIESSADTELNKLASAFNSYRKKLETAAYSDTMLGIGTRQKYLRDSDYLISQDINTRLSLFMIDIVEFGKYNDVFSTEVGDSLLMQVSNRLTEVFKNRLYRINGDVFLGILPECANLMEVGQNLHEILKRLINVGSTEFELQCRVAICSYPEHGNSGRILLEKVQSTMHLLKSTKSEYTIIYNDDIPNTLKKEEEILTLLRRRIMDNTLEVWYQPIFHQKDQKYHSAEALLRLRNDSGGFVSPFEAVTIAEKRNMIDMVGDYVLKSTCVFLKKLESLSIDIKYIQVNLSIQQLSQNNYAERALQIINEAGATPQKIGMEITETMMIQSTSNTIDTLSKLRNEGIHIAMDDFGSGYCGINYLSKLPLDILKLDRELVLMVEESEEQFEFVKTIFQLAKIKKILSVAEGVETAVMLKKISECGADCIQGYYFSKPLCEDDFIQFMSHKGG